MRLVIVEIIFYYNRNAKTVGEKNWSSYLIRKINSKLSLLHIVSHCFRIDCIVCNGFIAIIEIWMNFPSMVWILFHPTQSRSCSLNYVIHTFIIWNKKRHLLSFTVKLKDSIYIFAVFVCVCVCAFFDTFSSIHNDTMEEFKKKCEN